MDQYIPLNWYMRRKINHHSTPCVFDFMSSIFTPVPEPLVPRNVADYMVLLHASKKMATIHRFFYVIHCHPKGIIPDSALLSPR